MGRLCNIGNVVLILNRWVTRGRFAAGFPESRWTDRFVSRLFALGLYLLSPGARLGWSRAAKSQVSGIWTILSLKGKKYNHGGEKNGQYKKNGQFEIAQNRYRTRRSHNIGNEQKNVCCLYGVYGHMHQGAFLGLCPSLGPR